MQALVLERTRELALRDYALDEELGPHVIDWDALDSQRHESAQT